MQQKAMPGRRSLALQPRRRDNSIYQLLYLSTYRPIYQANSIPLFRICIFYEKPGRPIIDIKLTLSDI